jgi:hypothetical protein
MTETENLPVTTNNPFAGGNDRAVVPMNATAQTDASRAIAEVQAALVVARANPRDERRAMDRILNACQRPGLAENAVYSYSRGGSDISGPSIRLAEAVAQHWGNLQFGIREIDQRGGVSTVQAFAWDVETNTRREVTFQVKHERHTRSGSTRLTDPRDIYETVANQGARRVRACILAVIPGDVVDAAVKQCDETLRSKADTSPQAIAKLVEVFAALGVTKQQIEARVQRRLDAIQPAQVVALRKVYASLRDGMSSPEDWFNDGQATASTAQGGAPANAVVEEEETLGEPKPKAEPKPKKAKKDEPVKVTEHEQPPANAEQAQFDNEAKAQQAAAAASPPAGTLALPISDETELLTDDESTIDDFPSGTLAYQHGNFLQWDGKQWLPFADQKLGAQFAHRSLQRTLTQHFKRARMERDQAMAFVAETLRLPKPPGKLADLSLDQLLTVQRATDNPTT